MTGRISENAIQCVSVLLLRVSKPPVTKFMEGIFYKNSQRKFYLADGTEYTKVFENDRVVLGKNAAGEFHTFRREMTYAENPVEKENAGIDPR